MATARCPDCKTPIPGVIAACCGSCHARRRAALVRPPATAVEGDEVPLGRPPKTYGDTVVAASAGMVFRNGRQ